MHREQLFRIYFSISIIIKDTHREKNTFKYSSSAYEKYGHQHLDSCFI